MNTEKYLKRINYTQKIEINLQTLNSLQEAHLKTIPFENLDIHNNKKIELHNDSIFDKIVENKRGGFCYELNSLFYQLLKELGFDAKIISAKVYKGTGNISRSENYGREYDHLAIIVSFFNKEYLVDVGFGKFSLHPLLIELDILQKDMIGNFIFDKFDDEYFRINELIKDEITPQYIFTKKERDLTEFKEMCLFHQTSSDSHFTKKKVISMLSTDGRITLNDNQLKITKGSQSKETNFDGSKEQFEKLLYQYFGTKL
ncbi:arylamine N-acetyltransferase [Bernardetia sp. ABR2-2B]|uniref:arylamine N-acetyltransferase family protein n=1 Tax=Bernardetia sp. ABR2-2B TaxID=3127472 RepID=UPI0030CCB131